MFMLPGVQAGDTPTGENQGMERLTTHGTTYPTCRYQSYRDKLEREMDSLVAVPGPVWDLVADLMPRGEGELPGPMFRSLALGCAHTSLGLIQTRVWQHVESWPWIAAHP